MDLSSIPLNTAMTSAAFKLGGEHFEAVGKNVAGYVNVGQLKYYFTVDNKYVLRKLKLLFFPYLEKNWERQNNNEGKLAPPREDLHAPDLYIPSMAFVTYILVVGLVLGTVGRFSPEQLGIAASSAMGWLLLEVFVCYAALYLLNIAFNGVLELVALSGYKYVGLIAAVLAYVVTQSSVVFYVVLAEACASHGIFYYATMFNCLAINQTGNREKQRLFVIVYAALQALVMAWSAMRLVFLEGPAPKAARVSTTMAMDLP
eukprot:m.21624 g.21624  ORF g.21624 m.21624 type:complete len:259 (-) comp3648_c0_seq2:96-872(-)